MTREVVWTLLARRNLSEQIDFIAKDNPFAARKARERVLATALALGEQAIGRFGRVSGTFEKLVPSLPYLIVYAISPDDRSLAILRVIHTARDWPEGGWPDAG